MKKTVQIASYLICIIIGGILIAFTHEGPIHICLACGSLLDTVGGSVAVLIGAAGLGLRAWEA